MKTSVKYMKMLVNLLLAAIGILLLAFVVPRVLVFFLPLVVGWFISVLGESACLFPGK